MRRSDVQLRQQFYRIESPLRHSNSNQKIETRSSHRDDFTAYFSDRKYEVYLDSKDEYVISMDTWNGLTAEVEVNDRKRGTGKTIAWLEIEVLNELNS